VNQELEAFSYSVSHDLRAPLRHVSGFAALLEQSSAALGDAEKRYISTIVTAARRMGQLIDDLLAFSRVGRTAIHETRVDLNELAAEVRQEVSAMATGAIDWHLEPLPAVRGDRALLRLVLVNLFSNAVKYSSTQPIPRVTVGSTVNGREATVFVRDNGVGFDMEFADKLFGVFQRLHRSEEFEGTGIGLANVRRIVQRHGGRTWAEGAVNQGATFSFSLPLEAQDAH
jgi:light-regulated signal transduction histidine kinase (bacteriophytochrome)